MKSRIVYLGIVIVFLLLFGACQSGNSSEIGELSPTNTFAPTTIPTETPDLAFLSIPAGVPEAIDGVISPGEWDAALSEPFVDGSEIFLMQQDGYLYVAIRANVDEAVAGNIYLFSGNEISIHHASAALGTGRYEKDAAGWQLTQAFVWRCRETSDSEAARDALAQFFEDEGWVSINSWMGTPNELEFKIAIPSEDFRLAANYLTARVDAEKVPWPQGLQDASTIIMTSGLPQQLAFAPEEWAVVEIVD